MTLGNGIGLKRVMGKVQVNGPIRQKGQQRTMEGRKAKEKIYWGKKKPNNNSEAPEVLGQELNPFH